jgi:NADH-quinone oxidoreductase subunit G
MDLLKKALIISIASLYLCSNIELPLYKPLKLNSENILIDEIDKTQFLTNFTMGVSNEKIPLQIEMSSEEICLIDENSFKKDKLFLEKEKCELDYKIKNKTFDKPLYEESKGILGLSIGDIESKKDNNVKFVEQLIKKNIISAQFFYFEFKSIQNIKHNKVQTLWDYLDIRGTLFIGDLPKNKIPNKFSKVIHKIKSDNYNMHDSSSYSILFDMEKCIGCTSCVRACTNIAGQNVLECERKGKAHTVSGKLLSDTNCISCGQCTLACPTKAIRETDSITDLTYKLQNKNLFNKIIVCQFAPAIRINMAEALGVPAGEISTGKIVTALKILGFDYIFDTNFGADMTIVEEATEFVQRLNDPDAIFPMFTSCCPAWVNYVEKSQPDLIPNLSSCRSPVGMISSAIKNAFPKKIGVSKDKIYNVAIMPCTAKKDESLRYQLKNETDAVITSRELAKMIIDANIDFNNLEETELDTIYSEYTGGGAIFCATGGVMEAAVRSAYKFITGKDMVPIELKDVRGTKTGIKKASFQINERTINVAVAHGIKNAMDLINKVKNKEEGFENIHFIEVMACPGGCVVGGGSPKPKGKKVIEKRLDATYSIDQSLKKRTSQDNEQLQNLYKESYEGEFGSHSAHENLHTYYTNRRIDKTWGINFKQINFNHTSISSYYIQSIIKVENNFIVAPNNFIFVLQREFLSLENIRDKCSVLFSNKYKYILCDKSLEIEKFPKLEFFSDELNHTFVLEGKDLFVFDEKNEKLLFLIIFNLYNPMETFWELGLPFLKKENLYFNMEKEEIGIYIKEDNNENKANSLHLINFGIIVILFSFILFVYFLKKLPKKAERKKRINELSEDYEYLEK